MHSCREKAPAVSVIVPVYKAEKFLHRCIDSILAQTFRNFELILIDDGSPDGSGAICDEYAAKDGRVRVFHQENRGVARTRERGVALAWGTYLIWVDSDDYIEPDLLEKAVGLHEETGADIVVYGCQQWSDGKKDRVITWEPHTFEEWERLAVHGSVNNLWLLSTHHDLWEGEVMPEFVARSGEDNYMTVRLVMKARHIESIPGVLYHYWRDNEHSLTHAFTGWRFAGNAWGWYQRFQISRESFPAEVTRCAKKTLSAAVKAYSMSLLLEDLDEKERKQLKEVLRDVLPCAGYCRFRDKLLARLILAGWLRPCRWYAIGKLQKEARHNERIKNRRE